MPIASLPVNLSVSEGEIGVSLDETTYGLDFGYTNSVSGENLHLYSMFDGNLYWVPAGSNSSILPAFSPTRNSIILAPSINSSDPMANLICYPFPVFITFENLDQSEVENALSIGDDQTIDITPFLNNGEAIQCTAGQIIAKPGGWAPPEASAYPNGFTLKFWKSSDEQLVYPHVYLHQIRFMETTIPQVNVIYNQLIYGISAPVGFEADQNERGGNQPIDVNMAKQRLHDLGFRYHVPQSSVDITSAVEVNTERTNWPNQLLTINTTNDDIFISIIKLFQSITRGHRRVYGTSRDDCKAGGVDGRIDKGGNTESWLWANNAPRWIQLGSDNNSGYSNSDSIANNDYQYEHDWGTHYLGDFIKEAGQRFVQIFWDTLSHDAQMEFTSRYPMINTNDASWASGGNTNEHASHETGLDVDIRLLRDNGSIGEVEWNDPSTNYNRQAARKIIEALRDTPGSQKVLFNDVALINEFPGFVFASADHDDHIHLNICPPSDPSPLTNQTIIPDSEPITSEPIYSDPTDSEDIVPDDSTLISSESRLLDDFSSEIVAPEFSSEINVALQPGKTLVLGIVAETTREGIDIVEPTGGISEATTDDTVEITDGNIDMNLVDIDGNPILDYDVLLIAENGVEILIETIDGVLKMENLASGVYELELKKKTPTDSETSTDSIV